MFNLSAEYEVQARLAEIERNHSAAVQSWRARAVPRPASPGFVARFSRAVPLKVSVRVKWEPTRTHAGTSCETAT